MPSPQQFPELRGAPLIDRDYAALAARWIAPDIAEAAGLRRVASQEGAEIVGRTDSRADYAGMLIPYAWPGEFHVRDYRLRRDNPDLEQTSHGLKQRRKYLSPPGRANLLYLPLDLQPELLSRSDMPIVIVEGEFKTLALWRLAWHEKGESAEDPRFLPVGLQGVYNWRGTAGKSNDADGRRVDVKGPIPDLSRIHWANRRVIILFDTNVDVDLNVSAARQQLTRELEDRGAEVAHFKWPKGVPATINGIDDYLRACDPFEVFQLLSKAKLVTRRKPGSVVEMPSLAEDAWQRGLLRNEAGTIKPVLANAIHAFRHAPEFHGVFAYNEFSLRTLALKAAPWGHAGEWTDVADIRAAEWLQRQGIVVPAATASQAVEAVAHLSPFHPVRNYLTSLSWDGEKRIDTWLMKYFGVEDSGYARAVGAKWLISCIARVMSPGCQVDHCLIFEGTQGIRKSSALRELGGEWFTDDVGDFHEKDTLLQIHGAWIVELGELDAMRRSEISAVKAFIVRRVDRFRPPYGRRSGDFARQCVFAGSTNQSNYLNDETGARRFWPVAAAAVDLPGIESDRDQLWAEALARYNDHEIWWIEDAETRAAAAEQQAERYEVDPWDALVWDWVRERAGDYAAKEKAAARLARRPENAYSVSTEEVLDLCLKRKAELWTHLDKVRIARILKIHGMERFYKRMNATDGTPLLAPNGRQERRWLYRWPINPEATQGELMEDGGG
jgi:predicted P-loop ATPase